MQQKNEVSFEVIDDIVVITYDDGSQSFEPIEHDCKSDDRSAWQKFKDWLYERHPTPYVKLRNTSDPFCNRKDDMTDIDAGSDGKTAIEAGIKIEI